jgi:hypothetical protein
MFGSLVAGADLFRVKKKTASWLVLIYFKKEVSLTAV